MMRKLIAWMGRNRGVLAAISLIVAVTFWSLLREWRPLARWVESTPARQPGPESDLDFLPKIEFAPDGRAVLIEDDEQPRLRNTETGQVAQLFRDKGGSGERSHRWLSESKWMVHGRLLVGLMEGSDRGKIRPSLHIWEVPSGREIFSVVEVGDGLDHYSFVVSDDGSTLAFLQGPPGPFKVGVWSRDGHAQTQYYDGSGEVALSSDGHYLTVYETRGVVADLVVWDVRSSKRLATISPAAFDADAVAVSTDGRWVAERQADQLTLIEIPSGRKTNLVQSYPAHLPWFSPDSQRLFSQSPRILFTDFLEIWNLSVIPPAPLFEGRIAGASRDGQRLIQLDDHMDYFLKTIKLTSSIDSGTRLATPMVASGDVFQNGRPAGPQSLDGSTLAYLDSRTTAPPWHWSITKNFPGILQSWLPGWRSRQSIEVIDADDGQVHRFIEIPDRFDRLDFRLLDGGSKLGVWSRVSVAGPNLDVPPRTETTIEIWDVSGPGSVPREVVGPVLGSFLALGFGGWYDRRRRRSRASASPDVLAA